MQTDSEWYRLDSLLLIYYYYYRCFDSSRDCLCSGLVRESNLVLNSNFNPGVDVGFPFFNQFRPIKRTYRVGRVQNKFGGAANPNRRPYFGRLPLAGLAGGPLNSIEAVAVDPREDGAPLPAVASTRPSLVVVIY